MSARLVTAAGFRRPARHHASRLALQAGPAAVRRRAAAEGLSLAALPLDGRALVARLAQDGRLDAATIAQAFDVVRARLAAQRPLGKVIDLGRAVDVSATIVTHLTVLGEDLAARGCIAAIASRSDAVRQVLRLVALGRRYSIHATLDEALSSVSPR